MIQQKKRSGVVCWGLLMLFSINTHSQHFEITNNFFKLITTDRIPTNQDCGNLIYPESSSLEFGLSIFSKRLYYESALNAGMSENWIDSVLVDSEFENHVSFLLLDYKYFLIAELDLYKIDSIDMILKNTIVDNILFSRSHFDLFIFNSGRKFVFDISFVEYAEPTDSIDVKHIFLNDVIYRSSEVNNSGLSHLNWGILNEGLESSKVLVEASYDADIKCTIKKNQLFVFDSLSDSVWDRVKVFFDNGSILEGYVSKSSILPLVKVDPKKVEEIKFFSYYP